MESLQDDTSDISEPPRTHVHLVLPYAPAHI